MNKIYQNDINKQSIYLEIIKINRMYRYINGDYDRISLGSDQM